MGRNSRLRQQRRSQASGQTASETAKAKRTKQQLVRVEVPALNPKASAPPEKNKSRSPLSRLTSFFKPTPKQQSLYNSSQEVEDFISKYGELLGAIAWEGYQTHGRGIVFAGPISDSTIAIEFVPRKSLRNYVIKDDLKMFTEILEMSDPEKDLPMLYTTQSGDTMLSGNALDLSPPECYRRRRRQEEASAAEEEEASSSE